MVESHLNSNALILIGRGDFAGGKFIKSSVHPSVNDVLILILKASIKLEVFHINGLGLFGGLLVPLKERHEE